MSRHLATTLLLATTVLASAATSRLPRSTPEAEGVPSKAIEALVDSFMAADFTDLHSLIVTRHGKVIAEAYAAPFHSGSSQQLYSCSKTFTAVAAGLAVADSLLRLDDRLATFFPDLLPDTVSAALADVTVRHLLTMTSGIKADWSTRSKTDDWTRRYLSKPVVTAPGSNFVYDSMSTYLLAAIIQRVTGRPMMEYLQERVLSPIGVTDARWEISPEGVNTGGWGIWMLPESMARFGQLLLNNGNWKGRQLVPEEWVKMMKAKHVTVNQPNLDDYGLQMWTCRWPGASRADGAMGQFIYVIDNEDMVITVTQSLTGKTSAPREQSWLWDGLMPTVTTDSLAPDTKALKKTQKRLTSLSLPAAIGTKSSPLSKRLSGKTFTLGDNDMGWRSVTFDSSGKQPIMLITDTAGRQTSLPLGYRRWQNAPIDIAPANSLHSVKGALNGIDAQFTAAATYGWVSPDILQVKIYFTNWGSSATLDFNLADPSSPTLTATYNWAPASPKPIPIR